MATEEEQEKKPEEDAAQPTLQHVQGQTVPAAGQVNKHFNHNRTKGQPLPKPHGSK